MPILQPYPAYADTDLPWLPKIPKHWEVQRTKFIFKKMARPVREEDDVVTAFRDGTVTLRTNRRTEGFTFSIKEIGYQGIRKGDLVIHQMDGFAGAIGVSDSDGKSTPIYSVCVPLIPVSTHFYAYLLRHMAKSDFILSLAKGIRERSSDFRFDVFKELELPIPPLHEQRTIAAYLDRQTAKIDALIARKQRLLDLLAEQRAALISQAVTKGLNPAVKMKDSGVAWLGQVPSHWEIKKNKTLTPFVTSGSRWWAQYYSDDGALFIRIGNISNKNIDVDLEDVQYVTPPQGAEMERTRVRGGDVLISITANIGSVGVVPKNIDEAYINQHIALTRPKKEKVNPRWMAYVLISSFGESQFQSLLYGGTKDGLGLDDVQSLKITLPPIDEQKEIVDYLDQQTKQLSDLATKVETAIERLQEYRAALISSVVTGKVKVQGLP